MQKKKKKLFRLPSRSQFFVYFTTATSRASSTSRIRAASASPFLPTLAVHGLRRLLLSAALDPMQRLEPRLRAASSTAFSLERVVVLWQRGRSMILFLGSGNLFFSLHVQRRSIWSTECVWMSLSCCSPSVLRESRCSSCVYVSLFLSLLDHVAPLCPCRLCLSPSRL